MSKAVLPVSPDIYKKVQEIAEVSNKSLRQTSDNLLKIAFEEVWVGEVVKRDDGTHLKVIFMKQTRQGF